MDDNTHYVLVLSWIVQEHLRHLKNALQLLWEEECYVKA